MGLPRGDEDEIRGREHAEVMSFESLPARRHCI